MRKWFYSGLPKGLYALFAARIINRLGDFVRFFLTLYLTRILQLNEKATGLVVTLASAAVMIGTVAGGKLSDAFGHKRTMLLAQFLSACALIVCGFFPDRTFLPYLLIISQFFFGAIRPASQALLMDLTPPDMRQKAFSLLYLGINIGVAVGPMIAGFLFEHHRRLLFWGDAATSLIGLAVIWKLVPNTSAGTAEKTGETAEAEIGGSSILVFLRRHIIVVFTFILMLSTLVYSQHSFTLPLLLNHLFQSDSARLFGIIMSVNAVTVILFTPLFLRLLQKKDASLNVVWGAAAYGIGFGMLAFQIQSLPYLLLSTVIWTWGEIIFATNVGVFMAKHTPVNHRGRFAAIRHLFISGGQTLSPLLGGMLISALGVRGVWYPVCGLSVFCAAALYSIHRWDRKKKSKEL